MVNVGVIGVGIIGRSMIRSFNEDERFQVTAVWDLNPQQTAALQQTFPAITAAAHAEALLANPDVDLVYIATPPATHIHYSELAIAHNKAILCEKPLSVDQAAAQRLVDRATKQDTPNAINFVLAASPAVAAIENALAEQQLGDLLRIEIRHHFPAWPRAWQQAGAWLGQRAEGGFVREVFSHFAYMTRRLIGPINLEWSQVTYPEGPDQSEIYVTAAMDSNGLPIHMSGGVGGAGLDYVEWTLYGRQRSYRLLNWRRLEMGTAAGWQEVELPPFDREAFFSALIDMIAGQPHTLPDFGMGLEVQTLVEAILADNV